MIEYHESGEDVSGCVDFSESVCTTTYDEEEILEDCDDAVQARCTVDDENCKQFVQLVRFTYIFHHILAIISRTRTFFDSKMKIWCQNIFIRVPARLE